MNKKLFLISGAVVLCCIAFLAWKLPLASTYMDSAATPTSTPDTIEITEATSDPMTQSSTPSPAKDGQYINYSADIIAKTSGTKVLFFHAPWCPQCRALEASIQAGPIPSNVTIIKVDYDANQALRQKYGVTIQTTLVRVDDSGNLLKKYSAYNSPTLDSLKANVL